MKIEWTEPAVDDLQALYDYISAASPIYARRMAEKILERLEALATYPKRGRLVPETSRQDLREIWVSPFRVIYRLAPDRIIILTIVHGRRDFNKLHLKEDDK